MGFVTKQNIPIGEFSWLTVVSPEGSYDMELLLEPMEFPPAKTYQKALLEVGIPSMAFAVADTQREYERLAELYAK